MQLIQSIPFFCTFFLFLLNLAIKRKFFCISSLSLLYVSAAMLGSILLVEKPRTGVPYVRLDAMIFLSLCFVLLCLPALFFKDGKKDEDINFMDLPDNVIRFVTRLLCILTVPASIFYLFRSIPLLLHYLTSNISRGAYRTALPDFGGGFASIENFLLTFASSFSFIALFWSIYCIALKKQKGWVTALLFLGAMAPCIDSLKSVSRQILFFYLLFSGVVTLLFLMVIPAEQKKKLKKFAIIAGSVLFIPFMAISVTRFKDDLAYSIASYFSTGPYSFNADYAARTEGGVKAQNGFLTLGFHLLIFEKITDEPVYQQAKDLQSNFYWGGDQARGTSPEVWLAYHNISGAFSGEFKTAVGTFLLDYPPSLVLVLFVLMSAIFCLLFQKCKGWTLPMLLSATVYFFALNFAPIGWAFTLKNNVFILFLICTFALWLYVKGICYHREKALSAKLEDKESTIQELKDGE